MAKPLHTDARKRPFTQVRLYGDLAEMVEQRAQAEGKGRSTLVDELLRAAWPMETPSTPVAPGHRFVRHTPAEPEEPPPVVTHRAHVFAPARRYR